MPQIVECRNCAKKLQAPDALAGKRVACPACKAAVSIPPLASASRTTASPARPSAAPASANGSAKATPQKAVAAAACVIACSYCKQKFKGASHLQGKKVRCPACKNEFTVRIAAAAGSLAPKVAPQAVQRSPGSLAKTNPATPKTASRSQPAAKAVTAPVKAVAPTPQRSVQAQISPPQKTPDPKPIAKPLGARSRPRLLYLAFALAFLPLFLQTLSSKDNIEERISHTMASHPELEKQINRTRSKADADIFAMFPDNRIEGAHLSYFSRTHWVYAGIAAIAFFGVAWVLFDPGRATVPQWFAILAATSTIGIVSLLAFQFVAEVTQGMWITGRSILVLLFYVVKFIGYSYHAASDPDTGFLLSFLGFTFGVGLCEEITKAAPVVIWLRKDNKLDWRAACMLGLASGVGFGVAEGIMYAGHYYNGVMGGDIYLTRFISCVALHATWTASACLMAQQNLAKFGTSEVKDWIKELLVIISVPAVLHGLYDTLLKKQMEGLALVVALVSFAWLAFMIERCRMQDRDVAAERRVIRAAPVLP